MKAEMFLVDARSNHLILIELLYMVDSVNIVLNTIDTLREAFLQLISSAQMKCTSVPAGWISPLGETHPGEIHPG